MDLDPSAMRFVTAGERGVLRTWRTDTAQSTTPGAVHACSGLGGSCSRLPDSRSGEAVHFRV